MEWLFLYFKLHNEEVRAFIDKVATMLTAKYPESVKNIVEKFSPSKGLQKNICLRTKNGMNNLIHFIGIRYLFFFLLGIIWLFLTEKIVATEAGNQAVLREGLMTICRPMLRSLFVSECSFSFWKSKTLCWNLFLITLTQIAELASL